jgi:mono/diheme cytochrome c family protein
MQKKRLILVLTSLIMLSAPALFAQNMNDFQRQMMETMMKQNREKMQKGETQLPGFASIKQKEVEKGKDLFNDTTLGTNQKSCGSCHQEGQKPLDGRKVDNQLIAYIQYCYQEALGGTKVIDKDKLDSLVTYFNSLDKNQTENAIQPDSELPSPSQPMPGKAPNHEEEDW